MSAEKQKQRDDRARLAAAFAAHLRPAEAKKAVVALFKVAPSTAGHLISRGRFLAVNSGTRGTP